ncbi:MAG: ABC transporter substrate-binding protein [Alphaproteobacteria bacterium]|nr:ABC transporter substrate-binding protein [Alphaproteobacteria bacterium]
MRVVTWIVAALLLATGASAKDMLTLGVTLEPDHLDPTAGAAAAIDEIVYANVFEGLTRFDETGAVKPQLATSWTISGDGLTYTFALKPGVKFHDGAALTSADVKFSFDRARAPDSVNAQKGLFAAIDKVEAVDPQTARVTLARSEGALLFNLAWGDAVIVSPASAAGNKTNPIGTGPFRFQRWVQGDRVQLVRADARAKLAAATFKFIPDPAAQVAALLAGDIDVLPNAAAPEALQQLSVDRRFEVAVGTTEGETILAINNARKPFDDVRVRQALSYAVDRKAIIDGAMYGYGTPIGTHFAPHHPAYVDLTGLYPYDPAKARALLQAAGLAQGFKATLKLPPPSYARRGGEIIAAQLKQIGVSVEIVPVEWAQWLSQVFRDSDFDLTIVSHTEPMDIEIYGREKYYFNYRSDPVRAALRALDRTPGEAERFGLYRQVERLIAEDAANVFLFQLAKTGVWRRGLVGMWRSSPVQANDLTGVYWLE